MQPLDFGPDDWTKLAVACFGYLIAAPLLGLAAASSRTLQRGLVLLLLLLPSLFFIESSLMIASIEWYRGHTKGFLFSSIDVLAVALIFAALLSRRPRFSFTPPGTIPYALFCALCTLSIFAAERPVFTLMALVKFAKIYLVYIAAYNFLRDRSDLRAILISASVALMVQAIIVVKMRYVDGVHQAIGLLAHQNSLSMWSYFLGLPLFAAGLSRSSSRTESVIYFSGTGAAGLIVLLSLSRAAIAVFGAGALAILGIALLSKLTLKRATIVAASIAVGAMVLAKASDSIIDRWSVATDHTKKGDLRWVLNHMSSEMLGDSAIGIGWNNFNVVNSRPFVRYSRLKEEWDRKRGFQARKSYYESNPNTESLYWMYLAETGYPGFFGLLLWLGWWFWIALRNWLSRGDTLMGAFLFGLTVTLAVFYAHHQLERILTQTINLSAFMLFMGVAARAHSERAASEISSRQVRIGLTYQILRWISGSRQQPASRNH